MQKMKPAAVFREVAAGFQKLFAVFSKSPVHAHASLARTLLPQEKQMYKRTSNNSNRDCVPWSKTCTQTIGVALKDCQVCLLVGGRFRGKSLYWPGMRESKLERGRPRPHRARSAKISHTKDSRVLPGLGKSNLKHKRAPALFDRCAPVTQFDWSSSEHELESKLHLP